MASRAKTDHAGIAPPSAMRDTQVRIHDLNITGPQTQPVLLATAGERPIRVLVKNSRYKSGYEPILLERKIDEFRVIEDA